MGEVIIFSNLPIYTLGLVAVFCFLWGAFVFYKKAIEAHLEGSTILDMVVLSAFWAIILGRISFVLTNITIFFGHWTRAFLLINFPGVERWGVLLGLFLGIFLIVKKKKGKYLDHLDLAVLGYLSGVSFFWIGINFINFYWQNLVLAIFNLLMFIVFWKAERTYRLISWYRGTKSFAKSGFVTGFGIMTTAMSFLIEKILYRNMSIWSLVWSLGLLVAGLVLVYIRSGRLLADDIKALKIWNKNPKK